MPVSTALGSPKFSHTHHQATHYCNAISQTSRLNSTAVCARPSSSHKLDSKKTTSNFKNPSGSRDTAQLDMQLNGASIKFASVKAILDAELKKWLASSGSRGR